MQSRWGRVDRAGARAFAVPRRPHRFKRSTDALLLALSVVVLLVSGARVDEPVGTFEAAVEAVLTSLPLVLEPVWQIAFDLVQVWALLLIALALIRRRWGLVRDLAAVIAVVAVGAMVAGRLATGEWPDLLAGLGSADPPADFPSIALAGSAAVVAGAGPYLARPMRHAGRWLVGLAAASGVALGLVAPGYVLGALSLGWGAAALTHLVLGSPGGAPSLEEIRRALLAMGLDAEPTSIEPLGGRVRVRATAADGTELDVDIHSRDAWDSQLVVKLWRWLWYRSDGPDVAVTRRQQMEHQAFVTLLAERRGASVAPVVAAAIDVHGDALLVSERVGVELSDAAHPIGDAQLAGCWVSLAKLGDAGIRHGAIAVDHLRAAGDVIYLSDLDRAFVGSDDESRRLDEAQLLITTALLVGAERATSAALDALGPERLVAVTSFVQTAALTPAMRREVAAAGLDVDDFRKAVVDAAGGEEQELQQLRRFSLGGVITGVLLLIVAVTIVSAIEEIGIETIVDSVQAASLPILLLAFVIGQTPRVANAAALAAAAPIRLPFARLTVLQFAITFVNLAMPSTAARVAVNIRFFQRCGLDKISAITVGALDSVTGFVAQISLIVTIVVFGSGTLDLELDDTASLEAIGNLLVLLGAVLGLAVAAVLVIPRLRRAVGSAARIGWSRAGPVLSPPRRVVKVFAANVVVELLFSLCSYTVLRAFGQSVSFVDVVLVNELVALFAGLMPVPGGMGVTEAALTAGYVAIGVDQASALAAALCYRLITFYAPPLLGAHAFRSLQRQKLL
jgi:uncharacterized membrane protein YbhN (UPF0104 family)